MPGVDILFQEALPIHNISIGQFARLVSPGPSAG